MEQLNYESFARERSRDRDRDFEKISRCRQRGFAFISQALDCEETGSGLDLAPILYKLGIRELGQGIEMCESKNCESDPRLRQLKREMLSSLSRAKDRLEFFVEEQNSELQEYALEQTPGSTIINNFTFICHSAILSFSQLSLVYYY